MKELHTAHTDIKRLINELNHNENEVALDHFFQHLTQHGNDNAPECSQATSKQSENVRLLTTQDSNISHMDIDMHSLASTPVPTTVSASSLATAPAPAPMHIDLTSTSMDISAMSTPRKRKNADINPNGDGNSLKKLRLRSATRRYYYFMIKTVADCEQQFEHSYKIEVFVYWDIPQRRTWYPERIAFNGCENGRMNMLEMFLVPSGLQYLRP